MVSPRRLTLLAGTAAFLVLSALAIFASPLSAGNLEARLQRAADEALYSVRAETWATVEVRGQLAHISGLAPDEVSRDRALAALSRAEWAGGVVAGGITRVIDSTRLDSASSEFAVRADLIGGRLTLTGFVPEAQGEARLLTLAEGLFPGRASVDVRLAPGGAPDGWEPAVRLMLGELARLDTGAGLMRGDRLIVTGQSVNPQTVATVRAALAIGTEGIVSGALVRAPGGSFRAVIDDPALCEVAVQAALGQRPVAFSPGSAELAEASRNSLRRAGEAFARCETPPMQVGVRIGEEEGGDALALERANAIIAAMITTDSPVDRFTAAALPVESGRALQFSIPQIAPDPVDDAAIQPMDGE